MFKKIMIWLNARSIRRVIVMMMVVVSKIILMRYMCFIYMGSLFSVYSLYLSFEITQTKWEKPKQNQNSMRAGHRQEHKDS